jgi:hexaprenyl-diphosphate synthase
MNQLLFNNTTIRETMKETIINEVTRDDSHLWKYSNTTTTTSTNRPPPKIISGSSAENSTVGNHSPTDTTTGTAVSAKSTSYNINGSVTDITTTTNEPIHGLNQERIEQYHHPTSHLNGTTSSTINDSNHLTVDLLNDLYVTEETQYWPNLPPHIILHSPDTTTKTNDPFVLVHDELQLLSQSIRNDLIGTDHPVLNQAASYFFQDTDHGGKKIRPMMILLLSRALTESVQSQHDSDSTTTATSLLSSPNINGSQDHILDGSAVSTRITEVESDRSLLLLAPPIPGRQRCDLPQAQRRLAEISEMIHTASLFHDDVIDGSDTRRNIPTVHTVFGNKVAILAGDYLLARASICLARLRNTDVVETMSTIIEHLVRGEVMQLRGTKNTTTTSTTTTTTTTSTPDYNDIDSPNKNNDRLLYYLRKNFYKTASLMANSCKSTALLGNYSNEYVQASYQYGKHIGMAFQLVDDVLDFEGTLLQMGKPALSDLKAGLATAPVLFAAELYPHLETFIQRKFVQEGDIETTLQYVIQSNGMERTKNLARVHAEYAVQALSVLQPSIYRDALIHLAYKVVSRTK